MDSLWMKGEHARLDAGPAEKVSTVIEQNFVIIHVPVIEGNSQRVRVALERSRREGRNQQATSLKRHMHARRQMIPRAGDGSKITDIELGNPQITLPPGDVHRIEGIVDARVFAVPFD